jgi:hypothetical protein
MASIIIGTEALTKALGKDMTAREFVEALISQGALEIKPTLTKEGIRYEDVERAIPNIPIGEIENILRSLADEGMLTEKTFDRVIVCQSCLSPDVHSKYICRSCHSIDVKLTKLVEHQRCGFIAPLEEFSKGGSVSCPVCKTSKEGDESAYRIIGTCYQCEKCGQRFDTPDVMHICQNCGKKFDHTEAWYREINSYTVPLQILDEIGTRGNMAERAAKVLQGQGFQATVQAKIEGASKTVHTFDLLAEKGEIRLVIDISPSGRAEDITILLGKKVDVKPTGALLLVSFNMESLKPLGEVYGITIVDATTGKALEENLLAYLRHM